MGGIYCGILHIQTSIWNWCRATCFPLFFFFKIVSFSSFFLKVLLLGILKYQEDSLFLPADLTSNVTMYFQQHAYVYLPRVSLGNGYLHNPSHNKILLFLNNLQKLLALHRKTLKGWGEQVPNKTKSLYCCVLGAETRLRADDSYAAAEQVSAMGLLGTDPDVGDPAGTGGVGHWRGKSIVARHVSLSSCLWKTLLNKLTAVYISMPVPVCPDSYFQSAALKLIWMSHYFWPALTATGKSKHCLVHPLHSIDFTGDLCMGCILFLLCSHPLFSIFIHEHSCSARKGSPIPAGHIRFSSQCKSTSE